MYLLRTHHHHHWRSKPFCVYWPTYWISSYKYSKSCGPYRPVSLLVWIGLECCVLQVQADPHLASFSGSNWSIVVADKTVILFDQSYQTILLLLHFGIQLSFSSVYDLTEYIPWHYLLWLHLGESVQTFKMTVWPLGTFSMLKLAQSVWTL